MYDVVIIGGGPAGLSAALFLGRCRRRVLVCDAGAPRNAASLHMHGFLSRDGIAPAEFLRLAREDVARYDTVELRDVEVVSVAREEDETFSVRMRGGARARARKLMLATGVVDHVPKVEGIDELYGHSVHHCPYCDGWEVRDAPLAAYGKGARGYGIALELTAWSRDVVLLTDGPSRLQPKHVERLNANGIPIVRTPIKRLVGTEGILERVDFVDGTSLDRRAMFFSTGQSQRSRFAEQLGCKFTSKGSIHTGKHQATCVEGVYAAGDASHNVQWVIVAAAEGADVAYAVNTALLREDLK